MIASVNKICEICVKLLHLLSANDNIIMNFLLRRRISLIKVENVTKKYGGYVAVNDMSFTVNDGEIVGFLGPNGARKDDDYEHDYWFYRGKSRDY